MIFWITLFLSELMQKFYFIVVIDREGDAVQCNIGRSSSQQVSSIWESLDVDNSFGTERSSSNEKNLGSSISGKQIGKKSIWSGKKKLSFGEDGSSPGIKQRRIESQQNDSLFASPNLIDEAVAQSNGIKSPVAANDPNPYNIHIGEKSC
ncbi:hypothetical protein EZV62_018271 [Acer yangbiense]|uniref:Uncharacterized protein n=1 Tax=Acer yangbiense TaxID=1000413 RepID=A0A5C7HJA8_9ROSI|nr:hypothetical protein EZV62_018271 [Acer yangbiense]